MMQKAYVVLALAGCLSFPVFAEGGITAKQTEVMKQLLATYEAKAKEDAKDLKPTSALAYKPFTAQAGREFYLKRGSWQATDPTCSSCHTDDPKSQGKHTQTQKPIKPLAPIANPERFTDITKVERNFAEHCFDLLGKDCRASEKGNYIAYMMSIK